jgi:hypothetical protein
MRNSPLAEPAASVAGHVLVMEITKGLGPQTLRILV